MADTVGRYVATNDNANEYAKVLLDGLKQESLEDIDNLLTSNENRDVELWEELEVDPELVMDDFEAIEVEDRDLDWVIDLGAMSSASTIQFFLDEREELLIEPSAYRLQVMAGFSLTRAQLIRAGKREVATITIEQYQAIQQKFLAEFSSLKNISNKDLYKILVEQNALRPMDKHIADSMQYVARMTNYPPGSPQFQSAVADLTSAESQRGLQSMNRRSVDQLNTLQKTGGDPTTLLVWVLDPSSQSCTACPSNAGEVKTFEEWEAEGLPGADVCLGGDRCNCHLDTF